MIKYKDVGRIISVELPEECGQEGYSVWCAYKYNKWKDKYSLSMWLKRNDIDDTYKIDHQHIDTQYIFGTKESIRDNICRVVEQISKYGFFTPYIEKFEHTYKCFDRGNDLYEQEKLLHGKQL